MVTGVQNPVQNLVKSAQKLNALCSFYFLYFSLTTRAAALYHDAAAIAPGSGTVARISRDTYIERPACISFSLLDRLIMTKLIKHESSLKETII